MRFISPHRLTSAAWKGDGHRRICCSVHWPAATQPRFVRLPTIPSWSIPTFLWKLRAGLVRPTRATPFERCNPPYLKYFVRTGAEPGSASYAEDKGRVPGVAGAFCGADL